MHKIIIIEDQVILNDLLKNTLSNKYNIVATSEDASEMIELCSKYKPDLVICDVITNNNVNSIDYAKVIKNKYKDKIKILILTGIPEVTFLDSAKDAKIDGFIYKNIRTELLINSIESVLNGYKTFPGETPFEIEHNLISNLSNKELYVLTCICSGLEKDIIAKNMEISYGTLKNHISSILFKTKFDNIYKLAIYCVGNRYIIPRYKK